MKVAIYFFNVKNKVELKYNKNTQYEIVLNCIDNYK